MLHFLLISALIVVTFGGVPNNRFPLSQLDSRIVGGRDADIQELPYQLIFERYGSIACGAILIGPNVALTAAHCTNGYSASIMRVRGGSSILGQGGQVINVESLKQHPNYDNSIENNDISVLFLTESFVLGPTIQLIQLVADNYEVPVGKLCIVSGWGALKENEPPSKQLQVADLPLISRKDCEEAYEPLVPQVAITENMICAGYKKGGKDACQGDSGGPFVCDGVLAGIISWGIGCDRPEFPSVYANVAKLRGFIRDASGI